MTRSSGSALPRRVVGRLAELGASFGVSSEGLRSLEAVLVHQAADPTASTTVRAPEEAVNRHVADSLVALELPAVRAARRIADLGAGAGWPGLALAAALPDARVTLVDSAVRHCEYLERVAGVAGLRNVDIARARVEAWPEGADAHDLVAARALASLPVVCEYAAPLLAAAGTLVAWKGEVDATEAADGAAAAAQLGLTPLEVRRVQPFPAARHRTLHVLRKDAPTPARFPRRPGMATKRPLSAKCQ